MTIVFSGTISTSFSQMYLASPEFYGSDVYVEAFEGQVNGLFGGAIPGGAVIRVGIHTGKIPITVELAESAPPLDESWEEIVEAPCVITGTPVYLRPCINTIAEELPHIPEGMYRARFCATHFGMTDDNHDAECGERYTLLMWPEDPRPDEIVKQTSPAAIYWHEVEAKRKSEKK